MGFDNHFGLEGVIAHVADQLVEEHGADWVIERSERLEETMARAVSEASEAVTPSLVESLKRDAPEMLKNRRDSRRDYREMIEEHWSKAFDLYEMVLRIGFEVGTDFGESRVGQLGGQRTFRILTRLHARGCRVAEEILVLLKNGYGQGALARWRSLHEVTCVAMFIAKHGEDVAERYLLHDVIESCRATEDYEQCASRLGYEPLSEGELDEAQEQAEQLKDRFGKPFMSQYGWAAEAIGDDPELSYEDKLVRYGELADSYFDAEQYHEFCSEQLAHVDEIMVELVESDEFDRIVVDTVTSAFPAHEHEHFIAHYRGLLGAWAGDQRAVAGS